MRISPLQLVSLKTEGLSTTMNKQFFLFFFLFWISMLTFSQGELEQRLLMRVNELRDSLELPLLTFDPILKEAGYDQAFYMADKKELSHTQNTFTRETPADRIFYFGGNRTYTGENVAVIGAIRGIAVRELADSLFTLWYASPNHYKNMVNPLFTKMGTGIHVINKTTLYAAQVFSSNEIRLPKEFTSNELSWGVRPSPNDCRTKREVKEQLFFANRLEIVDNAIYFFYHDMQFFKRVIKNDNDGIAIDFVLREQLPCDKENQLHISPIYDGEMQRPIYRNELLKNDVSFNPGKIRVKIGEVPDHLVNKQWHPSVIIINDNQSCDYNYPVFMPHDIIPLLPVEPYMDYSDEKIDTIAIEAHIQDSIHIEFEYLRSKNFFSAMNGKEFYRMLNFEPYIHEFQVNCFASVEGEEWLNLKLLDERKYAAQSFFEVNEVDTTKMRFSLAENWIMMEEQIERHDLTDLKKKDKNELRYWLKRNKDTFLDSLLYEQRKTHVYAYIDTLFPIGSTEDYLIARYYDSALRIQEVNWNKILREEYIIPGKRLPKFLVDSLYNIEKYRTNFIAALTIANSIHTIDSVQVEQLVVGYNQGDVLQKYNFVHFLTNYWFVKYAGNYSMKGAGRTVEPDKLFALLETIENQAPIEKWSLNRLRMNLLLSGIHYYVTHNEWSKADAYFNLIYLTVKNNDFTLDEAKQLALFCNHFHKFHLTINLLDLFFDEQEIDEDGIFILAQTATIARDDVDDERYSIYMEAAKKANKQRYCAWLDTYFQMLRDEALKRDFCVTCR